MLSDPNPWADNFEDDFERASRGESARNSYIFSSRLPMWKPGGRPVTSWASGLTPDITARAPGADLSPMMRAALGLPARPTIEEIAQLRGMDPDNVPATQGQRAGALLIDGLSYSVVAVMVVALIGAMGLEASGFAGFLTAMLMTPIGFFGYRSLTEGVFEGSPGKHIMGLRVVGQRNLPISTGQAAKRNLWHLAMMFPPVWPVVALVMSISGGADPMKQNNADRWSQTQVVHKDPQQELMRRRLKHAERFGPDALGMLR